VASRVSKLPCCLDAAILSIRNKSNAKRVVERSRTTQLFPFLALWDSSEVHCACVSLQQYFLVKIMPYDSDGLTMTVFMACCYQIT
jgi:hypothetical protein